LLLLVLFLVVAQFVPLERTSRPADPRRDIVGRLAPPAPVAATFDRSCRDCHSNTVRWPWYSRVAPVSWLVVSDVNEGRRHLNLSEWDAYDQSKAAEKLNEICDEVKSGGMPDFKYTLVHRGAVLSDQDVAAVCGWTTAARAELLQGAPKP
jgi:hypothetical protein